MSLWHIKLLINVLAVVLVQQNAQLVVYLKEKKNILLTKMLVLAVELVQEFAQLKLQRKQMTKKVIYKFKGLEIMFFKSFNKSC